MITGKQIAVIAGAAGAFVGGVVLGLGSGHASPPPIDAKIEALARDVTEMRADIKAIKCKLNIDGTCPR